MARTAKATVAAVATATEVVAAPVKIYPTEASLIDAGFDNLSKRIRQYAALGMSTAEIAKVVTRSNGEHPRYQHVRNVLNTPLKTVKADVPATAE
jgi:hypothetical protein